MELETNKITLILFCAVVIASGCTDNGDSDVVQSNPVTVTDFSPSQDVMPADSNMNLEITMENTGKSDVEHLAARISGPTFASASDQDTTWRAAGGDNIMVHRANRTVDMRDISAPGDVGDSVTTTEAISLTTPAYGEGRSTTENFNLDVFYRYETQASTELLIMTEEAYLDSDVTSSVPEVDSDPGPIQLEMLETVPKVQEEDSGDIGNVDDLCLQVRNEGPGTPFSHGDAHHPDTEEIYNLESDHEDRVNVTVSNIGDLEFSPGAGETGSQDSDGATVEVELINDEERACFEWESENLLEQDEQTTNIELTTSYGYTVEDQNSVTVEGR